MMSVVRTYSYFLDFTQVSVFRVQAQPAAARHSQIHMIYRRKKNKVTRLPMLPQSKFQVWLIRPTDIVKVRLNRAALDF
jgi:hypothetical protein